MLARLRSALGSVYRRWRGEDLREKVERVIAQTAALDLETARGVAAALLADTDKFECLNTAPSDAESEKLRQLGPELKSLLTRYSRVTAVDADFKICRAAIGPSSVADGMLVLGEDGDQSQILVYPNEDRVFIAEAAETFDEYAEQYPSIHHYIALLGALVYDVELPVRG